MSQKKKMSGMAKTLIVMAAVIAVGIGYYFVVIKGFGEKISALDSSISDCNYQIQIAEAALRQIPTKQAEIEECKNLGSSVQVYDNNKEEQIFLSNLLKAYDISSSFSFSDPVLSGNYVKREVNITFNAENYEDAEKILNAIKDCEYRNVIENISLEAAETRKDDIHGGLANDENNVEVSIKVIFIETTYGSTDDVSGLKSK